VNEIVLPSTDSPAYELASEVLLVATVCEIGAGARARGRVPVPVAQVKQDGAARADSRRCAATYVPREVVAGRRVLRTRDGHDAGAAVHYSVARRRRRVGKFACPEMSKLIRK